MKKLMFCLTLLLSSYSSAYALDVTSTGIITSIALDGENSRVVFAAGTQSGNIACSVSTDYSWAIPITNSMYKELYALLLSAAAQKLSVSVTTNNRDALETFCSRGAIGGRVFEIPKSIIVNY